MTAALQDQAEGLRRLVNVRAVRCIGLLGPSDLGLGVLADAMAVAWSQRNRQTLVIEARSVAEPLTDDAPRARLPNSSQALLVWGQQLAPADVVLGLLDPLDQGWPCLAFDEFVMVASATPNHLTQAYAQLKALSALSGRTSCHVMFTRTPASAATRPMQNLQQTARKFLGCVPAELGIIPDDPALAQAAAIGRNAVESHPKSPAVRAIRVAVERLDSLAPQPGDWSAWLQRLSLALQGRPGGKP